MNPRHALPALALCLLTPCAAAQRVPAEVRVKFDEREIARTGRCQLEIAFTPRSRQDRNWLVRLELHKDRRRLWRKEHAPKDPCKSWQVDRVVRYRVPLALPLGERGEASASYELWLGFVDPRTETELAPEGSPVAGGMLRVAKFRLGESVNDGSAEAVRAKIEEALAWAKEGRKPASWNLLCRAHRSTEDYDLKAECRKALLTVGRFEPRAIDALEHGIVQGRIAEEKRRYVRRVASRMLDRKRLQGALYLLKKIGGALEEGVDQAHIGDLDRVRRVALQIEDVERRILRYVTPEQQKALDAALEKHGTAKPLMELAEKAIQREEYALARRYLQALTRGDDVKLRRRSLELFPEVEKKLLAQVPADQLREAEEAWNHPAWARTKSIPTHEFIVIGPETLLEGISETSKIRFDIAYLYLTDLFGRVPNPEGDRVTVYYKELWDFGGGVGGGKRIDVGSADPFAKSTRLDNGLLYHELVHCVDDTNPVLGGFREGLADFGAAFVFEALGQKTPVRWTYVHNLRAFEGDYLHRDLEFWRIPDYGPSAGFFLWFLENYGKKGQKRQWQLYRRFFRAYRGDPVRDGRTPSVVRALAHRLMEQFGPAVFDDLQRFRFPLRDSDREALTAEQKLARDTYLPDPGAFERFPGSPVPRDVRAMELHDDRAQPTRWREELGVVRAWKAIGPFKDGSSDPGARVWPPEYEVDFSKTYDVPRNTALWRPPASRPPIQIDDKGWLSFHWEYMDNSAIYALTHVKPPQGMDARIWLRADDEVTLFLNDELVGHYRRPQSNLVGPWRPGRRVLLADAIVFDVRLRPGRNKVLLKIRNYHGGAGVVMAVSDPAGKAIPGLEEDIEAPARITHRLPDTRSGKWRRRWRADFTKRGGGRSFEMTHGGYRVRRRGLEGTESKGGVPWRKYTVRPGFRRDAPSNFGWLRKRYTKELEDFRLTIGMERGDRAPKFALCFQGQGNDDPLSGWTLLVVPRGKGLRVRLERYGRLVYQSDVFEWPGAAKEPLPLVLLCAEKRCSVTIGETLLLDQVPMRFIDGRSAIGLATWRPETRFTYAVLEERK